jgi:hypothetical protein
MPSFARKPESAADAEAAYFRDGGLRKPVKAGIDRFGCRIIALHRLDFRTLVVKFRNIGAGNEGLAARPGDDHNANGGVSSEIGEDFLRRFPHREADGVTLFRIVERHRTDARGLLRQHLAVGE